MTLATKLAVIFGVASALLFSLQGAIQINRLSNLHKSDIRADLRQLAASLQAAGRSLKQREAVRAFVENLGDTRPQMEVSVIGEPTNVSVLLARQNNAEQKMHFVAGDEQYVLYASLQLADGPMLLRITRDLSIGRSLLRRAITSQVLTTCAVICIFAIVVVSISRWVVRRRIDPLILQARQVSSGRYVANEDRHNDELGHLAKELNSMVAKLQDAKRTIAQEREARTETLERLRHADRLSTMGKLASTLAHEIGTPLNVIGGRASMIEDGDDPQKNARIIAEQADRVARITENLLSFARRRGPQKVETKLLELCGQARLLLAPLATRSDVTIVVAGDDSVVHVDPSKILQVLTNLMTNGIQAMPAGGVLTLEVDAPTYIDSPPEGRVPSGRYVRVSVSDQGMGMTEEQQTRIFEAYFTTKDAQGTGLGLSVCDDIVREHEGWFAVDSTLGNGSRFSFYLRVGEESGEEGA